MKRNDSFNAQGCVFRCIDTIGIKGEKIVVAEGKNAEVHMFLEDKIGSISGNIAPVSGTVAVTTKKRGRRPANMTE